VPVCLQERKRLSGGLFPAVAGVAGLDVLLLLVAVFLRNYGSLSHGVLAHPEVLMWAADLPKNVHQRNSLFEDSFSFLGD
jgi:hypothetical protein